MSRLGYRHESTPGVRGAGFSELVEGKVEVIREKSVEKSAYARLVQDLSKLDEETSLSVAVRGLVEAKKEALERCLSELEELKKGVKEEGSHREVACSSREISPRVQDIRCRVDEISREVTLLREEIERYTKLESGERIRCVHDDRCEAVELEKMDELVTYWTDFDCSDWHPSSFNVIGSARIDEPFDIYALGEMSADQKEKFFESVRIFSEECNRVEGFQLFIDADTAYGAISNQVVVEIQDEYPKASKISYPLMNTKGLSSGRNEAEKKKIRHVNRAVTFSKTQLFSDLVVPIDDTDFSSSLFPELSVDLDSVFHRSALLASAIDSSTLPYRFVCDGVQFPSFVRTLAWSPSCNVASLFCAVPFLTGSSSFPSSADPLYRAPFSVPFFPLSGKFASRQWPPYCESLVVRGLPTYVEDEHSRTVNNRHRVFDALAQYSCLRRHSMLRSEGLPVPAAYPQFFSNDSFISSVQRRNKKFVHSARLLSHLQTTAACRGYLQTLAVDVKQSSCPASMGIDRQERSETEEQLLNLVDEYKS
ncbi:uncharacterized protein LOC126319947 [Schistocerca gregaria]|uniref:uncharacterized protein LOC126319947 n=1 Tax=Schistocerca gregaria TaxID=7010 RepID=UPI00211F13FB|nr:uncharacterized protein LOC126319947 [Schistocerca gregaria]